MSREVVIYMYLAELHGKLSPRVERMEDILTSDISVFEELYNACDFWNEI